MIPNPEETGHLPTIRFIYSNPTYRQGFQSPALVSTHPARLRQNSNYWVSSSSIRTSLDRYQLVTTDQRDQRSTSSVNGDQVQPLRRQLFANEDIRPRDIPRNSDPLERLSLIAENQNAIMVRQTELMNRIERKMEQRDKKHEEIMGKIGKQMQQREKKHEEMVEEQNEILKKQIELMGQQNEIMKKLTQLIEEKRE